jgi:O-antigen/teichoic acid export membrane protein
MRLKEWRRLLGLDAADQASAEIAAAVPDNRFSETFARSVRHNVIAEITIQILRIGGMIVLARALRPQDFGLLKVLLAVSTVIVILCEAGLPEALVQRSELTQNHEATARWLSFGLAGLCVTALYGVAPAIADLMVMPNLRFALRLLCLPILIEATSGISNARLRRGLNFGSLALADALAEAAFLGSCLLLVANGEALWSLAGGLSARYVVHGLTVWVLGGRPAHAWPRMADLRTLWRFSFSIFTGRILTTISNNVDYLLVGRFLGSEILGFYGMAWDLLRFVEARVHNTLGRVAISAFSRLQDDNLKLRNAYREFSGYLARLVIPMMACIALAAPELIGTVYGPRWYAAVVPLRILSAGLSLTALRSASVAVYYAKNQPALDVYLNGFRTLLVGVAVVSLLSLRLPGISVGVSMAEAVISIVGASLACSLVGLNLRILAAVCLPATRLAALCALVILASKAVAQFAALQGPSTLVLVVVPVGVVFYWLAANDFNRFLSMSFN